MNHIKIGIIGGSGLYEMDELKDRESVSVKTPFGNPSDGYITGNLYGIPVAFLPRNGRGHKLTPSEINYRANIFGFKKLGVEQIISVTAVGSLREGIPPRDIVIPDQFLDRARTKDNTFFGNGIVAHIPFADPVCPDLSDILYQTADDLHARVHRGGTLVCIEGPAFSTRAESNLYRSWGMDIIGMTSMKEAKLAREAEICYSAMALVTDYDCWHEEEGDVTVETVIQNMAHNISLAKQIILDSVKKCSHDRNCLCANSLKGAIMTDMNMIPDKTADKLGPLIGKYL